MQSVCAKSGSSTAAGKARSSTRKPQRVAQAYHICLELWLLEYGLHHGHKEAGVDIPKTGICTSNRRSAEIRTDAVWMEEMQANMTAFVTEMRRLANGAVAG